jgi:aryl-alcohol dehydrogenase-like predicted oxidoreductase
MTSASAVVTEICRSEGTLVVVFSPLHGLQRKHREQEAEAKENRAAPNNSRYSKTNSVMTLQCQRGCH